jgi:repressor LexA
MLTLAQQRAYNFIKKFVAEHSHAPTVAEVASGIGIKSKGVAHRYIQALADAHKIRLATGRHRNIELLPDDEAKSALSIPLVGNIAAGRPITAILTQETLDIEAILAGENRFALRVKGDSMIDNGILDGDLVICESCDTASNGDIVVALIDNEEATLKHLQKNNNGTVTLNPANSALKPMVYPADKVQIQGRFLGLLRLK